MQFWGSFPAFFIAPDSTKQLSREWKHHHCNKLEKKSSDNAIVQRNKLPNSCLCVGFIALNQTTLQGMKSHHCKKLEKKKGDDALVQRNKLSNSCLCVGGAGGRRQGLAEFSNGLECSYQIPSVSILVKKGWKIYVYACKKYEENFSFHLSSSKLTHNPRNHLPQTHTHLLL